MLKGLILWMLGVDIPTIELKARFSGFIDHETMVRERIKQYYPDKEKEMWGNLLA